MRSLSHVLVSSSSRSPSVSAGVLHRRRPRAERQRDPELQVQSRKAHTAVQVDEGCARVRGFLLPDAE